MDKISYSDEYYKVSFITTHSRNIPALLKRTGGLIIMSETDHENRKSLWFRGDCIASGYGVATEEQRDAITYLANTYQTIFNDIDERITAYYNYFKDRCDYLDAAYAYTLGYIASAYADACDYTDRRIERLIGGAPEFLDTLAEISYWLKHDQSLGIDMATQLRTTNYTYITHERPDENGYAYMSSYIFSYNMTEHEGWRVEEDEGQWHVVYFTYNTYDPVYKDGSDGLPPEYNAMRDVQVATHYGDMPLDQVLDALLAPYPYAEPTVEVYKYENASNDKAIYNADADKHVAEVGVPTTFNVTFHCEANDAETLNSVNPIGSGITWAGSTPLSYQQSADVTMTASFTPKLGNNVLYSKASYTFTDAVKNAFPQLYPKYELIDEEHAFTANTRDVTIFPELIVPAYYRIFWNIGLYNSGKDIPTSTDGLVNSMSALMCDTGDGSNVQKISTGTIEIDKNCDYIWYAVPQYYIGKHEAYFRNLYTDMRQPISELNDSNFLTWSRWSDTPIPYAGTNYYIYVIKNIKFDMASDYVLEIMRTPDV